MSTENKDFRVKNGLSVAGGGTFGAPVTVGDPIDPSHAATKDYVDSIPQVPGPTGPAGSYIVSDTAPANPENNVAWFDTTTGATFMYHDGFWIETTGAVGPTGPTGPAGEIPPTQVSTITGSYTITSSDKDCIIKVDSETTATIVVNDVLSIGQSISFVQWGPGKIIFSAGDGVTVGSIDGNLKVDKRYSSAKITCIGLGAYLLTGDELSPISFIAILGGSSNEAAYGISSDGLGNIYVAGYSTASGSANMQLVKYSPLGILEWQRSLGLMAPSSEYAYGMTSDTLGNVYITGYSNASGTADIQIAKYDTNGIIQWQRRLGGMGTNIAYGIATDVLGNVYVVGSTTVSGTWDIQIAKYDTNGIIQWQRRLASSSSDNGVSVTTDIIGNVYIAGNSNVLGATNIQVTKYNYEGILEWQRILQGSSSSAASIVSDKSDGIYILGTRGASTNELQLIKYTTSGVLQWQRSLTNTVNSDANSAAVDSSGNVYILGRTSSAASGMLDIIVAKYDPAGVLQWQRRLGNVYVGEYARSIAVDISGNICISGYTDVSGTSDVIIAKLPGDGSLTGTHIINQYQIAYQASSLTDSASSLTDSVSSLTDDESFLTNTTMII